LTVPSQDAGKGATVEFFHGSRGRLETTPPIRDLFD
jgi:hypothetical protein